ISPLGGSERKRSRALRQRGTMPAQSEEKPSTSTIKTRSRLLGRKVRQGKWICQATVSSTPGFGTPSSWGSGSRSEPRQGREIERRALRVRRRGPLGHGIIHTGRDLRPIPIGNTVPKKRRHRLARADLMDGPRSLQKGDGEPIGLQLLCLDCAPVFSGDRERGSVGLGR